MMMAHLGLMLMMVQVMYMDNDQFSNVVLQNVVVNNLSDKSDAQGKTTCNELTALHHV